MHVSELLRRLDEISVAKWQPEPAGLLTCYHLFAGHVATFGAAEQSVLQSLDLQMLADPVWWTRLVLFAAAPHPAASVMVEIASLRTRLTNLLTTIPRLLQPFHSAASTPDSSALTVRLPSPPGRSNLPQRVSTAIEAIVLLWDVVTALAGQSVSAPGEAFVLASYATSPVPVLSFTGPPVTIAALKAVLASLWSEVIAHPNLGSGQRAEQLPRSLPLMRAIEERNDPASAMLRIKAEQGLRLFLETGANTPEMDDLARFSPDRLLRPAPRLVTDTDARPSAEQHEDPPPGHGATRRVPAANGPAALDALIAEEREMLMIETQRSRESDRAAAAWVGKRPRV